MTRFGYTMMCEQSPPDTLVRGYPLMIATEPKSQFGELFEGAGGEGKLSVGQIALVQIGGDTQSMFLAWPENELLPALREL
jgi:hypothetical protein